VAIVLDHGIRGDVSSRITAGFRELHWPVADPIGQPLEEVRRIRGDIAARLKAFRGSESDLESTAVCVDLEVARAAAGESGGSPGDVPCDHPRGHALWLEYFTVGWNVSEAVVPIVAGL
jgi:hypothetical protein